jgi:threonyl-tRNA synthetase
MVLQRFTKRYAEFGTVYRYEQSGELHGLTRVRGFTQDDAHLFCTPDQLDEEFKNVIDLVLYVFGSLGFENFTAQISLRDQRNQKNTLDLMKIGKKQKMQLSMLPKKRS